MSERPSVRSKENVLVFGSPALEQTEKDEVVACLKSRWLGTGPRTARFERDFAAYKNAPAAVSLHSCTAALHLAMVVTLNLKPGDEVVTTPLTFCATVNAILHAGGVPVLADIDPVPLNNAPDTVRPKISPRTRAILPVHFAALPLGREVGLPAPQEPDTRHARRLFTILVDEETSGIGRDLSLPEHPSSQQRLGWKPEDCPEATRIGREIVSLPIAARLEEQDVADVITAVRRVLSTEEAKQMALRFDPAYRPKFTPKEQREPKRRMLRDQFPELISTLPESAAGM